MHHQKNIIGVSPLAQSYKDQCKKHRSIYNFYLGDESNSSEQSMNYLEMNTQKLTDNYLQKINHKNKLHFKIQQNNENYRRVEKNINE